MQYANTNQRMVEVLILRGYEGAQTIEARGTICSFNSKGSIDVSEAADAVSIAIEGSKPKRLTNKVLDIGPVIRSRRWSREHTWKPAPLLLRKIAAHIKGQAKIPLLRPS